MRRSPSKDRASVPEAWSLHVCAPDVGHWTTMSSGGMQRCDSALLPDAPRDGSRQACWGAEVDCETQFASSDRHWLVTTGAVSVAELGL